MTDTAKPTPGPWYYVPYPAGIGGFVNAGDPSGPAICDVSPYEQPEINGRFIAEAGSVFHETNLTPRQLLEQRDELANALNEIANSKFCNYDETSHGNYAGQYGIGVTDGHRFCANIAIAALAKCGKVGG